MLLPRFCACDGVATKRGCSSNSSQLRLRETPLSDIVLRGSRLNLPAAGRIDGRYSASFTDRLRSVRLRIIQGLHRLQHRPEDPVVHLSDIVLLMRIRFDVEHLRIAFHRCGAASHAAQQRCAARAAAAGRHVGEKGSELFSADGDQIGTDECQQMLAMSAVIVAEQQVAQVDPVERPVVPARCRPQALRMSGRSR